MPQSQGGQAPPVPAHVTEHPFKNVKDTTYMPPSTKNVGAQDKAPSVPYKCADPAYRMLPLVYNPAIATAIFQQSMKAPITITQRELLSLYEDQEDRDFYSQNKIPLVTTFTVSDTYNRPIPKEALIIGDEIEAYYRSLGSGEDPDLNHLMVTEESHSICSLSMLIDNSHKVECILDLVMRLTGVQAVQGTY